MSTAMYVIRPDSVIGSRGGAQLRVGLPWYRSIPWAGLAGVDVRIDGVSATTTLVDGAPLEALALREDYWNIQHRAAVEISYPSTLRAGETIELDLAVHLRIPGPLDPEGNPMKIAFETVRQLVVQAPAAASRLEHAQRLFGQDSLAKPCTVTTVVVPND